MSTFGIYLGLAALVLIISSKIPGIEHLVRPIIDIFFALVKVIGQNAYSWSVWLLKAVISSHIDLVKNLFMTPEELDPIAALEEE